MVFASLVGAAALAPDTENTVAYQGLALLFVLFLVSMACRWTFRARFAVKRLLPR